MRVSAARLTPWSLVLLLGTVSLQTSAAPAQAPAAATNVASCPHDDSGVTLPAGFCASIFAEDVGHARHMVVSADNVLYVNTWSGRYFGNKTPHPGGFLVALQETHGTGKADVIERFGETVLTGGAGGTGIGLYNGYLYAEINDKIVRYKMISGSMLPSGAAQIMVSGLPLQGDHPMHPFTIDASGSMFVDVGTATNACQVTNRTLRSPGIEPCVELATRGGIWRFDANQPDQVFTPAQRYATGIRNAEGFGMDAAGQRIFITQHGRDQLHANWPALYAATQEATLPSEELLLLTQGGDYGWPKCYYDPSLSKLVLAPEYGGDGGKTIGACGSKSGPVAAFPAHWAPNGMVFYDKKAFPERYRNGLFIAFHGSWDRAPYAQDGFNVVFQALAGEKAAGKCEIFADGFAGVSKASGTAAHRPTGIAVAGDGALYVSDDSTGRIYKIVYTGQAAGSGSGQVIACPDLTAGAGPVVAVAATLAGGKKLQVRMILPPGVDKQTVDLGRRIYHGEVAGALCTGCHGPQGAGSPQGPDLTDQKWLWSDGSVAGIAATITQGVSAPQEYRALMPAMGGAQLSTGQVSALSAYVWTMSHHTPVAAASGVHPKTQ